jgi:phenylalanyl-tRNA synthetase beta chain
VRQSLGIQSDSSYRFERGVDLQIVEKAAGCAAGLIRECSGGKYVLAKSAGRAQIKKRSIFLRVPTVAQILGSKMSATEIKRILNSLGLKTRAQAKNSLRVDIPSYRPDLVLAIDLIEEIARIHGFASIPRTLPALKPEVNTNPKRNLVTLIKNILIGLGLNEVVTYSLTDRGSSSSFGVIDEGEPIEILNPLSREQEILRPRLMPSLAACVAYNLNQKQDYVNIFEIAGTFTYGASGPREELRLGIALCGSRSLLLEGGLIRDTAGLLHLKGIIEELFTRLGIREYRFKAQGAGEITVSVANEKIGSLTRLAQNILEGLGIKNKEVFVAELKLERLFASTDLNKKFAHLAVYPGISRDISLILKEEIPAADILSAIKEHGGLLLRQAKVVDYYKGKQIPAGFKGLTLSCLYRADERTLTEAEITPLHSRLCTFLKDRFSAQIR